VTIDSHVIVHPNNRLWLSDLTRWEQDVATWEQELATATAELDSAAEAAEERRKAIECDFLLGGGVLLEHHRTILEGHRQALEGHRNRLREELAFLTEYEIAIGNESGEPPPETVRPTDTLAERVARHPRLWDAHERLGRHHRAVMEATAGLLRALAPPK
jgi:hypothetical protein